MRNYQSLEEISEINCLLNNIKNIPEFTRNEIQLITNGTFLLYSIKTTLYVLITISQIDIALIKVTIGEITCIFTTYIQLSNKTFMGSNYVALNVVRDDVINANNKI